MAIFINLIIIPATATNLKIHFIDVGQGDSILLQSGGKNMLVDAGPSEAGSKVISYLKTQGVSSLDVVVATHPHEDHIGGMNTILDAFKINLYIDNGASHTTSTYENLINKLVKDQTPYAVVKTGKIIPFSSGISVTVLSPLSLSGDYNEDSIVLKVTNGKQNILLTGDSSQSLGSMKAQILKVPHHGSKYGSSISYLSLISPEVAIISVGARNDFGHPAQETLSNLEKMGSKIYRTDNDGTVVINTDGTSWSVNSPMKISTTSSLYKQKAQKTVSSIPISTTKKSKNNVPETAPTIAVSSAIPHTSSVPCNCNGPDKNCKDFSTQKDAQVCFDYCKGQGFGDCFKLDKDKDQRVCESL